MLLEWSVLFYFFNRNELSDPSGWIYIKEIDEVYCALDTLPKNFFVGEKHNTRNGISKPDFLENEIKQHRVLYNIYI